MKTLSDYRATAREALSAKWSEAVVFTLVYMLVVVLVEGISGGSDFLGSTLLKSTGSAFGSLLSLLVIAPLGTAFSMVFLGFVRGNDNLVFAALWERFKSDYTRILSATLIISVMIMLGIFTLGILSIYFALCYAMVPYLLRDYPELTWREAMQTSREMMEGHKWEFFLLQLSFIGWAFLAILTCGIGLLWLIPYMETTYALYYDDLKSETIVDDDAQIQDAEIVE